MGDDTGPDFTKLLEDLVSRVENYGLPVMPSSQRLFLMDALKQIKNSLEFPTYRAENLASTYLDSQRAQPGKYGLSRTSENNVWQIVSSDHTVVGLFSQDRIERETQAFISSNVLHAGAHFIHQMSLARMKNNLITTVSHELKTPLASIHLLVDTLIDGKYKDENLVKEYIELIAKENERLSRLIENFLTFSRLEDKHQTFDFRLVDPEKIVRSVYDTIKPRFESGGFSFELIVSQEMPDILFDYDAMVMVLLNLLDNAYNYSDKVRSVALSAYSEDGNICFDVRDQGIGLSPEQRKRILEPFYQVDQTLSRKGKDFGLGLSIVKSIVDVHHGSIEVESEQGKGSTFTIKVPVS